MAQSFGIVEEKLNEADFFLEQLKTSRPVTLEAKFYFSAFISAARSVTLALQATMSGVAGFKTWYEGAQRTLKANDLAASFVELRNDSIHKGLNPINEVTLEHLQEHLFRQMAMKDMSHVLVLPDLKSGGSTVLTNAVESCSSYFASLVELLFECYEKFKYIVDPRWHFTAENFASMGKSVEDALEELGFPREWLSFPGADDDAKWRALRSREPYCGINHLFHRYLGRQIADPDDIREG